MGLEFGTYAQVFKDNEPTNTMAPRTTGAIALSSMSDSKGDYSFMSTDPGQKLIHHQWTVLPMPSSEINQMTHLAKKEGQLLLKDKCLLFEKRPGIPLHSTAMQDEADLDLHFKDEGEDNSFEPLPNRERDVPLLYHDPFSLNELADLAKDADEMSAVLSSSDSNSDPDNDYLSTASSQGAIDDDKAHENRDSSEESPLPYPSHQ